MQTTRKQILAAALAVVLIAAGALFLIAPVWQPQRPAAAYAPVTAAQNPAPEPELIDINTATAALVAYRTEHGAFASLADAAAVRGISLRMTESWAGLAAAK